jgi:hypothetical protein
MYCWASWGIIILSKILLPVLRKQKSNPPRLRCLYVLRAWSKHPLINYKVTENEHKNNLDEIKVSRNIISLLYADEFYDIQTMYAAYSYTAYNKSIKCSLLMLEVLLIHSDINRILFSLLISFSVNPNPHTFLYILNRFW